MGKKNKGRAKTNEIQVDNLKRIERAAPPKTVARFVDPKWLEALAQASRDNFGKNGGKRKA
jgi:hypothetical protein